MFINRFDFTYYYPPRPILMTIDSPILDTFSNNENYVAEIKMNGTNCEVKKTEQGKWEFWDRLHNKLQYNIQVIPDVLKELDRLEIPNGSVLNAELLHNKTTKTKHFLYFHTIIAWNFELYDGVQYGEQRKQLENLFEEKRFKHLILAPQQKGNFKKYFYKIIKIGYKNDKDIVEGIVIKNLSQKLRISRHKSEDFGYKIRKPHKNYIF
jgi:hypothetical protein